MCRVRQERLLGDAGHPRKVKPEEDPFQMGLVLEWVYGTIVSTAEKARDGAKRPLGAHLHQPRNIAGRTDTHEGLATKAFAWVVATPLQKGARAVLHQKLMQRSCYAFASGSSAQSCNLREGCWCCGPGSPAAAAARR